MSDANFRLRHQSIPVRIAISCFLLIVAGGYLSSFLHMVDHHGKKDAEDGLGMTDLVGFYSGIRKEAPLLRVLDDKTHQSYLEDGELELLKDWLEGRLVKTAKLARSIVDGYEYLPEDAPEEALAPADILDERCNRCHSPDATEGGDIGKLIPLNNLPSVEKVAFSKELTPITTEILMSSTHAHALGIAPFAFLICLLFLATGFPTWLRHGLFMLCFVGLLMDLASMWLARLDSAFVWTLIAGGGVFGLTLGLGILLCFVDLWILPRRDA